MDLRSLHYFVAVVDHDGVRRAAEQLRVAPSALSRAVDRLEGELGVELLYRTAHGTATTRAGRDLLEHARGILRAADDAVDVMRRHATRPRALRVGLVAGVLAASELTRPILSAFRRDHPETPLEISAISFCDPASALLEDAIDVGIVRSPVQHHGVEQIPIGHEPRVLLVGAGHELAGVEEVDIPDVLDQPTIRFVAPAEWAR